MTKLAVMVKTSDWLRSRTPLEHLTWCLWRFLLISIPITSFPLVAKFTGSSTVSALAGIPLACLFVLWLVPYLLRRGNMSVVIAPLLVFFIVALLASALSPFYEIHPYLGRSVVGRTLRGLFTLAVGVGFYLVAANFPRSQTDLRLSLRWLYLGAVFMLAWASLQAFLIIAGKPIPSIVLQLHDLFSIRDMHTRRVTGLAYEPSWLANQLVILYFPLWISSVVKGYSVFGQRIKRFSIEFGLLIWGAIVLFFSFSRIGFVSGVVILCAVTLGLGWNLADKWAGAVRDRWEIVRGKTKIIKADFLRVVIWVLMVLLILLAIQSLILFASRFDSRIERVIETDYIEILKYSTDPIYSISRHLGYAERLAYWTFGTRVFCQYPLLGVGLGNAGFFFIQFLPAYGHSLHETIRILSGSSWFPNPKNLWARLLAETGIVGFIIFVVWMFVLALGARFLLKRGKGVTAVLGMAGLLALLAQIFEGFSLDSFALPQLWIMLGLMTAALSIRSSISPHSSKTTHKLE